MTFVPSGSLGGGVGAGTLVQPAQQLGLPYTSLSMSKLAQGKDEEGSRKLRAVRVSCLFLTHLHRLQRCFPDRILSIFEFNTMHW